MKGSFWPCVIQSHCSTVWSWVSRLTPTLTHRNNQKSCLQHRCHRRQKEAVQGSSTRRRPVLPPWLRFRYIHSHSLILTWCDSSEMIRSVTESGEDFRTSVKSKSSSPAIALLLCSPFSWTRAAASSPQDGTRLPLPFADPPAAPETCHILGTMHSMQMA